MLRINCRNQYTNMEDPHVNASEPTKVDHSLEVRRIVSQLGQLADSHPQLGAPLLSALELPGAATALGHLLDAISWVGGAAQSERFDAVEREIVEDRGPEILRALLQLFLDLRGTQEVGPAVRLLQTQTDLRHRRVRERTIETTVGAVVARRQTYALPGHQQVVPLDEALHLPSRRFSPTLTQRIVTQVARAPYDETARTIEEMLGRHVSTASMLRLVEEAAVDFDAFYGQRARAGAERDLLVAVVDCKGVVIREQRSDGAPEPTERGRGLTRRRRKGEKANTKKMACVAVVYEVDRYDRTLEEILASSGLEARPRLVRVDRPRPENKRVWGSLEKSKDEIFEQVREEMLRRDPEHQKKWVCVIDGEPALEKRAREILGGTGEITIVRDIFHVTEYLWTAAHAFWAEGSEEAKQFVTYYLGKVLEGKASEVARGLRQSATKQGLRGARRKSVDDACRYLLNGKPAMRYDQYLKEGLPIGSGVVEGACRHLVKDRMERAGMRWTEAGAEAVLRMRAIEICGDTKEYWRYHLEREHARRYGSRPWVPVSEAA